MNIKDLIKSIEDDYIREEELTKTDDLYKEINDLYDNNQEINLGNGYKLNPKDDKVYNDKVYKR